MHTRYTALFALLFATALVAACSDDTPDTPDANPYAIPEHGVSGTVYDFYTGDAVAGPVEIEVKGLLPVPQPEINGAQFAFDGVPPSSVLNLVVSSGTDYRRTYNQSIEVVNGDLAGVQAKVLSESYLQTLAEGFGVTPEAGTSILIIKAVDETGAPRAGISANAFYVNNAAPPSGPYFLDENKQPAAALTATGPSGYAVFYNLDATSLSVSASPISNYTMTMPVSPAGADAVTLAEVVVVDGEIQVPTGVSFVNQIVPIFENRGCIYCHAGGGGGRQDGNLSLQGSPSLMYSELTEEISPRTGIIRVNLEYPEQSLILTLPGPTIDGHPNTTFASENDPDYQLILGWIIEGAQDN